MGKIASNLDLAEPDDVLCYLSETPFASSKVESLSGGDANYVFRLHLKVPYEGKQTLIMKYGRGCLKINKSFVFDIERQVNKLLLADLLASKASVS